jgi:hypothetical protein
MKRVLEASIKKHCLVCIEGIDIVGKTINYMVESLDPVLGRLKQEGGSIDLERSRFLAG